MTNPVATFAIPCRDAGQHLQPLLESLLAQTRQNFALLLCDDGSQDGSAELAQRIAGDRIRIVATTTPRGLARNFAWCASLVRTPFFCLAHQDDRYEPRYLERMLPALQGRPSAAIAHCRAVAIDARGAEVPSPAERYKDRLWRRAARGDRARQYRQLFGGNFVCCPSVLFRTEHFRRAGGFRIDLSFALDWELWMRLLRAGFDAVAVDSVLVQYRRHGDASSRASTQDLSRFHEEHAVLAAARTEGIATGLLPDDCAPSPALRNTLLHEALEDLRAGDETAAARKLEFLRDQVPELWGDPYVRAFRTLSRLGPPGRAVLGAGRAVAVRFGLGSPAR